MEERSGVISMQLMPWLKWLVVLIFGVVILTLGYMWGAGERAAEVGEKKEVTTTNGAESAALNTYTSEDGLFSFNYPSDWEVTYPSATNLIELREAGKKYYKMESDFYGIAVGVTDADGLTSKQLATTLKDRTGEDVAITELEVDGKSAAQLSYSTQTITYIVHGNKAISVILPSEHKSFALEVYDVLVKSFKLN